jgi:hypothetical protein
MIVALCHNDRQEALIQGEERNDVDLEDHSDVEFTWVAIVSVKLCVVVDDPMHSGGITINARSVGRERHVYENTVAVDSICPCNLPLETLRKSSHFLGFVPTPNLAWGLQLKRNELPSVQQLPSTPLNLH